MILPSVKGDVKAENVSVIARRAEVATLPTRSKISVLTSTDEDGAVRLVLVAVLSSKR